VTRWYEDQELVSELPARYQAYAAYSRLLGDRTSRRVPGGSFLLRLIRDASSLAGTPSVARVRGIDGLSVVTDFADERVLDVIHEIRGENPEYRVMQSLLSPGATFVDVGANFGTFSLLASRVVGSTGKVIAIEPQERLASFIEKSIELSGVTNCEVHRVACGRSNGEASLLVPSDDSGRAGFFPGFSGRKSHVSLKVPVTTLDFILRDVPPGSACMIKIDVEGSEMNVLEGAIETIRRLSPAILIEINQWSAAAAGRSPKEIIDRLVSHGYRSFASAAEYPATLDIGNVDLNKQMNIVATT